MKSADEECFGSARASKMFLQSGENCFPLSLAGKNLKSSARYSSVAVQSVGGNEICQNPGTAVSNSTGTRNPPCMAFGVRVTRQPMRCRELLCSSMNRAFAGKFSRQVNSAPLSFTSAVCASIVSGFPGILTCSLTGTRSLTRWLRLRSSCGATCAPSSFAGSSRLIVAGHR